jgi:phosphopantothenoylcysteine decarboxylase/phosphopantothenate--cysteine ligase
MTQMTHFLTHKRILLGITGSIAAYKSPEIVRRLREAGADVRVVMTENAKRFITPLTLQAVSGHPVHEELFDIQAEAAMGHIELARWADAILIAPATADCITRLAHGNADDLLTTLCLAAKAPIAVAPAMNQGMYSHMLTQENLRLLKQKNIHVLGTGQGSQACGDVGPGRLLEPAEILEKLSALFATGALAGLRVVITAGPTHEPIDPIRFITNGSSGKMAYALAQAAREAGAAVTMVSGPVQLPKPQGMDVVSVVTAQEMYEAVMRKISDCDIFLAVAAVSDYRCQTIAPQKIHKDKEVETLSLERNPDIVASVGNLAVKPFIVGFAAETENVLEQAQAKRQRKNMNMIVANRVGGGDGMGSDENQVIVIGKQTKYLPLMSKYALAKELIDLIAMEYEAK